MLIDLGHHAQGVNIEQIVALLDAEGRLGGFHFNNRKYADDDLIVGSVNPFELFLIFFELAEGGLPRLTIDQSHNVEAKVEAMVLSIVNLQEAYAKALLVDRDALRAAQEAGDVLGGHEVLLDAYRSDVREVCARARAALGAEEDPVAAHRESGYQARTAEESPMSTVTPLIDRVEDLWPDDSPPDAVLDQLVQASHLLGANRAVSNFGGGNTSAKGTAEDHTGREIPVMWVKGSGSDLATMGPEHFTALKLDEVLPLIERDEMSDEDMVAYLSRCQLDPAAPRCSIETLLHAFVPAPHVHHTHPDGINVLAGSADGERLVAECFGDAAAWIPYIRPGFTLSKQVGEAARANPDLKLVVLAKHGLVVWGDSAEEAYRRTIEVINQAVAFVNERTGDVARFGGRHAGRRPRAAGAPAASCCRPIRGAVSSEKHKLLTVDTSERALEFVSSADAERLVTVGAPCPDHLVHTKRLPLWIPYDPEADDADALRERIAAGAEAFRDDYRDVRRGTPRRVDRAGRPRPADRADPAPRAGRGGARRPRPRSSRATSTTARSR